MTSRPRRAASWPLLLLFASGAGMAQYKVVGPDNKVTYTDRPPAAAEGRVTAVGKSGALLEPALPLELRQPSSRYPVTLYTTPTDCEPCDAARQLLRARGIPHAEKQVSSAEDSEALEKLSGGREAPTLSIGTQVLRGLSPEVWNSYLDAAGYPRESRLPAGFQFAEATPLTERREVPGRAAAGRPAVAPPVLPSADRPAAPGGIKF